MATEFEPAEQFAVENADTFRNPDGSHTEKSRQLFLMIDLARTLRRVAPAINRATNSSEPEWDYWSKQGLSTPPEHVTKMVDFLQRNGVPASLHQVEVTHRSAAESKGDEGMTGYTPSTEEVRQQIQDGVHSSRGIDQDAFDRWLTAHDAEKKAEGLEEAAAINDAEAATFKGGENEEGWPVFTLNLATEKIHASARCLHIPRQVEPERIGGDTNE
jgi:hypothetical protein